MGCGAPTVNGVPVDEGVVVGGSGAEYASIAAGQAGEAEQSAADTTAAGTVAGTVIATVVPAWLAVGDIIVLTDATPGNGLTCLYGVIRAIAGTTLTIDKPWNFGVGEGITYVRPIILTLKRPQTENVTFTKNVIFNLAGNVLSGSIDFTTGAYHEISGGSGVVSNGITTTNLSVTILVDIAYVGRRAGTNYAYIMTSGSDVGATECYNTGFGGIVSGRRGYGRWIIDDCQNDGVAETDQNCPWRPFESVAGIAIVVVDAAVQVSGTYSGCIFYSENNMTGPAAFTRVSLDCVFPMIKGLTSVETSNQPCAFYTYWANGAATMTMTTTGSSYIRITNQLSAASATLVTTFAAGSCVAVNASGTININISGASDDWCFGTSNGTAAQFVSTGSGTCSATVTLNANTAITSDGNGLICQVWLKQAFTGSIALSGSLTAFSFFTLVRLRIFANQTAGAPSVTISGSATLYRGSQCNNLQVFGATVSVGTWTLSGSLIAEVETQLNAINLISTVSGGTWTVSGTIIYTISGNANSFALASHAGTGGTLTVSSATIRINAPFTNSITLATATGAGATVAVSAASIVIRGARVLSSTTFINATTATSTVSVTGAVQFEECEFAAAVTMLTATAVGGVATGPSSLTFNACVFESTFTGESGSGTRTYTTTLYMRDCSFEGLVTVVLGTGAASGFTVWNAWETFFNGSSGNKSIAASGTRPTVAGAYRFWSCYAKALINDKNPEVVRQWVVRPAAAAVLAWGQVITIAGAGAVATACGAASIVRGVVLDVTAGVGGEPTIIVTDGEVFVKVLNGGAVAASDNLILDPGAFVAAVLGAFTPGQNVGVALEAEDATFADKVYSSVRAA